ncbi:MAG: Gfo/Idh/MocA family oxidoreductase [Sphaerochaetaceae bacterium]|nr:Gfo/Idh/MocA family oxidoreductase [Sphaerochaetaceae bacterium]
MSIVKYGILGFGSMGTSHSSWLYQGARVPESTVTAVCDINEERRKVALEKMPDIQVFDNADDFFAKGDFDAVILCIPHYQHPKYAIQAFKAGKHVMCEKPAGIYTSQIEEMNAEAAKHPELSFAMMFNQRINPLYQQLKQILDRKEIGELRRVSWMITTWWRTQKYYDSSAWRATWGEEGGGILVNQAPHQLDLIQWLFGLPTMVHSFIKYGSHRDVLVDDDVTAYFEFPNGCTGSLITCTFDPLGTDRLEILGDEGKIVVENSSKVTVMKLEKNEEWYNRNLGFREVMALVHGQTGEKLYDSYSFEYPEHWDIQHIDTLINFTNNILHGEKLISEGHEGINAVQLANAMYLSSWTNSDVKIPVDGDLFKKLLDEKVEDEKARKAK